jgi:hypothetical protein
LTIRRRHVFYIEGYDPQGAAGYHRLFNRELKRSAGAWRFDVKVGDVVVDSGDLAHWDIESSAPNWRVETRYEFLRFEDIVKRRMAEPLPGQFMQALAWIANDLFSGALSRTFRASWRFGLNLVYQQSFLVLWPVLSALAGIVVGLVLSRYGVWSIVSAIIGAAVAYGVFRALRLLIDHLIIIQLASSWVNNRKYAHGQPNDFDRSTGVLTERIVDVCRAADVDEILIVGHSSGCGIAPVALARALALDPDLGRHGPKVSLLTLGSLLPAYALHPRGRRMRDAIERLAIEPSIAWIDCQARRDVSNFWGFDPVDSLGHPLPGPRHNPLIWIVRFRDMLSAEAYRRAGRSLFRMHFQFIMGGNRRSPFDYFIVVCGPLLVTAWQATQRTPLKAFGPDGAYLPEESPAEASGGHAGVGA